MQQNSLHIKKKKSFYFNNFSGKYAINSRHYLMKFCNFFSGGKKNKNELLLLYIYIKEFNANRNKTANMPHSGT